MVILLLMGEISVSDLKLDIINLKLTEKILKMVNLSLLISLQALVK